MWGWGGGEGGEEEGTDLDLKHKEDSNWCVSIRLLSQLNSHLLLVKL